MQFSSRHVNHVEAWSFLVALLHDILKQPHERGKFLFPPSHPGGVTGCSAESAPQTVETQDHLLNATQVVFAPETFNPLLRAAKSSCP